MCDQTAEASLLMADLPNPFNLHARTGVNQIPPIIVCTQPWEHLESYASVLNLTEKLKHWIHLLQA